MITSNLEIIRTI